MEHDEHVIQMNEVRRRASGWVHRAAAKVVRMISEPGHPTGDPRDPLEEETTMFKTISAALLAVSVLAAPALAATTGKTAQAPVTKTTSAPVTKAPVIKAEQSKSKVLNANARMGGRHYKHVRHHRHHGHMGALKTHATPKLAIKPVTSPAKRG